MRYLLLCVAPFLFLSSAVAEQFCQTSSLGLTPNFSAPYEILLGSYGGVQHAVMADVDGDGVDELVVAGTGSIGPASVSIHQATDSLPGGGEYTTPWVSVALPSGANFITQLLATNMGGSRDSVLAVDDQHKIYEITYESPGLLFASEILSIPHPNYGSGVLTFDLDGDGLKNDILVTSNDTLHIYSNRSENQASFYSPVTRNLGLYIEQTLIVDINSDGLDDIAVLLYDPSTHESELRVLYNLYHAGTPAPIDFHERTVAQVGLGSTVLSGRINRDRHMDLLVASPTASGTSVALSLRPFWTDGARRIGPAPEQVIPYSEYWEMGEGIQGAQNWTPLLHMVTASPYPISSALTVIANDGSGNFAPHEIVSTSFPEPMGFYNWRKPIVTPQGHILIVSDDRIYVIYNTDCGPLPFCGDGVLNLGEECDDGNLDNGDSCDASCHLS
ncbi:MAG: hypothetical protein KDD55_02930 [Bdellovibrionales bacterium]|nr:hypothetical protein [Bdellovibrionales bacterium]